MSTGRPPNPPRTDFETRLRELMAAAKIASYAELAEEAKIDVSTIQRVCSGKRSAGIDTLTALASALDCTVDDLLRRK